MTVAMLLGMALPVSGQTLRPTRSAAEGQIERPKLSPYLNLLRNDNSVLSPYHAFVLPQRELRSRQLQQGLQIQQLQHMAQPGMSTAQGAVGHRRPTGGGGHFHSYLHFYSSANQP